MDDTRLCPLRLAGNPQPISPGAVSDAERQLAGCLRDKCAWRCLPSGAELTKADCGLVRMTRALEDQGRSRAL